MSAPSEFIMSFAFKLVYTDIVYNVEISSNETLNSLFDRVSRKFEPHIDLDIYYIDFVIAGQDKGEMASSIGHLSLDSPLWYEFENRWNRVSFYVRPMNRNLEQFIRHLDYGRTIYDVEEVGSEPNQAIPQNDSQQSTNTPVTVSDIWE